MDFKKPLPILILILALVGGGVAYVMFMSEEQAPASNTPTHTPQTIGFALLVSYTNNGFEPSEGTVYATETVRFINNSSHNVWIKGVASRDNPHYPGTSECGGQAFDTCAALAPGDFWEFTFSERGTWLFENDLNAAEIGVVYVQ